MNVSPTLSMWINIVVAILGVISAGVLPSYFPTYLSRDISETASLLVTVFAAVNAVLHGASAPVAGPLSSERKP